jgi:hypothetical protein
MWTNGLTLFRKKNISSTREAQRTPKYTVWSNADTVMLGIEVSTLFMFFKGLNGY